ncbi:glycosyltransferase family 39 protein [Paenibacillus wynnii]|uniref:Uncharacterized protein n=1 Tax=Paenibacillus wynnii TaxID=268407 RepID=A0A098MD65_9BACL|nr:glycosyltransferase family 39 protein [Paenibacillus wynnii]KGE19507.1 hypothetical protein PWYN_09270 [Paenibacillus wynnii]
MKFIIRMGSDIVLLGILVLAAFLYGYEIWNDQYANTYYTTAVGSMLQSFHNFFFVSLDSAGSVTVDKPPETFWIQTLGALIFGLHGWSVILPQALGGVGSVLLVYLLVKPTFGRMSARLAALAMATTPVAAAVSRTNNIDAMLVFTLLLAAWFLFKGTESNKIGSLIASFALIGVGFNEKMLQAYMVLPAFYLFYILAAKVNWKRKTGVLAASTAVLLVVSLSWAVIVDSIPASKRPYIGSSGTNSVLNLAFGYNGVSRLTGDQGKGGNGGGMPGQVADNGADGGRRLPAGAGGGFGNRGGAGAGSGGMFNTGTAGPLRLFQSELSGQSSWLLPFAAFACIGLFASLRRTNFTQKHKEALFWLAWLVPIMGFFSIAGFFHQYYLIMMAPPIAALAGAGWSELWSLYRDRSGWLSWLLPAATLITAALQWYILHPYDNTIGSGWSIGILLAGAMIALLLAAFKGKEKPFAYAAGLAGLLVLLIGPMYWALTPITYGQNSMIPAAGPTGGNEMGGFQPNAQMLSQMGNAGVMPGGTNAGTRSGLNKSLLTYLQSHNTDEKYLFAVMDYNTAAPYIVDEGAKVVILNGFSGSDKVYTADTLEALVESGKVRYFLVSSGGMGGGRGGNSELTTWINENGTEIPAADWQGTGAAGTALAANSSGTLYEVTLK